MEDDTPHNHIQEKQCNTSFQLQTNCNHTNPLRTFQSSVLWTHSNNTNVTTISSVPCWYNTEDHLLTVTLMTELSNEKTRNCGSSILKKPSTLKSMTHCGKTLHWHHEEVVQWAHNLCTNKCNVSTISHVAKCETKRCFIVHRCNGTMLPLLEKTLEKIQIGGDLVILRFCHWWSRKSLSNLRIAHDILLFANPDLTKIIAHLRYEATKYVGKTKILASIQLEERPEENLLILELLPSKFWNRDSRKYLGRKLTYSWSPLCNKRSKVSSSSTNETV